MHTIDAVKLNAFASVTIDGHDPEYFYRHILRWYSKAFTTPLEEVYDLPIDFVLQHFFECRYEDMSDEKRDAERLKLLETPQAVKLKKLQHDADEVDEYEFLQASTDEERKKHEEIARKDRKVLEAKETPKAEATQQAEISMKFIDDSELEELLGTDTMSRQS